MLLILDPDGRRRSRLSTAAEAAGHRPFSAGTLEEAVRVAGIYQPEVALVAALPPGADLHAVRAGLAQADMRKTDRCIVLEPDRARKVPDMIARVSAALEARVTDGEVRSNG